MNLAGASAAHARSLFALCRTFGALFVVSGTVLAKRAIYLRGDANDIYDRYLVASTSEEAERLFERTSDRDTKSHVATVLSIGLLLGGCICSCGVARTTTFPKWTAGSSFGRVLPWTWKGTPRNEEWTFAAPPFLMFLRTNHLSLKLIFLRAFFWWWDAGVSARIRSISASLETRG